ncbi:MAG: OB-fold-containig protein [Pseudomonadota bacterium]
MTPFTMALALVMGLLILEVLMSLIGLSLMGEGPDADIGDADFDAGLDTDIGPEIDGTAEIDGAELDPDADLSLGDTPGGLSAWLGFGEVPIILWAAGMLTAFGISGYLLQTATNAALGISLPLAAAIPLCLPPTIMAGRWFARTLARIVPKTETAAINRRSLGGRRGVIAQGSARRGSPAQARVRDGHGNFHYVRVEPVDGDAIYPQGTEVLIRDGRGPVLFALAIDDLPNT